MRPKCRDNGTARACLRRWARVSAFRLGSARVDSRAVPDTPRATHGRRDAFSRLRRGVPAAEGEVFPRLGARRSRGWGRGVPAAGGEAFPRLGARCSRG
jgi:hypothetical protein